MGNENEQRTFKNVLKTDFLKLDILFKIHKQLTLEEIYSFYGYSAQRFNYHLKQLKADNLIFRINNKNPAIYELTPHGRELLKNFVEGQYNISNIHLHNVQYKYNLLKEGNLTPDQEKHLNTTLFKLKKLTNVTVEWSHKSLTINVHSLFGTNAYQLLDKARSESDKVSSMLKEQYGFELGEPELTKKPHYAIIDPVTKAIGDQVQIDSEDFKIDKSRKTGELEFHNPKKAQAYIEMPNTLEQLKEENKELKEVMREMVNGFSFYAKHMVAHVEAIQNLGKVSQEMSNTLKDIKENLKK